MGKILKKGWTAAMIATAIAASTIPSCNTVGCLENQSSIPQAGFYSSTTDKAISVDSIKIYGIGAPGDSALNSSINASSVYLPFRSDKPSTSFAFRYLSSYLNRPELIDTLTFDYDSEPRFVSEECGAMFFYRITKLNYTTHLIDSVAILDSLINNLDIQRIRVYFRTAEPAAANTEKTVTCL